MTKLEEQYEGSFLDALDLPEGKLIGVTIESIAEPFSEKDSAGKVIKQAIITFKKATKRLILNKTNYKCLKAMFGKDSTTWIGQTVNVQRRYLDAAHGFGVQNTLCIRIIPPVGTPILKSTAQFMGSATPYGDVPRQKQAAKPAPKQEPATNGNGRMTATLAEWKTGVEVSKTLESCAEFRRDILPTAPDDIREAVELFLNNHEESIRQGDAT